MSSCHALISLRSHFQALLFTLLVLISFTGSFASESGGQATEGKESLTPFPLGEAWCGPRSAYSLARFLGVDLEYDEIIRRCRTDAEGFAAIGDIAEALRSYGLSAETVSLDYSSLRQSNTCAILIVDAADGDSQHAIVYFGTVDGYAQVLDPTNPSLMELVDPQRLVASWDGRAILVSKHKIHIQWHLGQLVETHRMVILLTGLIFLLTLMLIVLYPIWASRFRAHKWWIPIINGVLACIVIVMAFRLFLSGSIGGHDGVEVSQVVSAPSQLGTPDSSVGAVVSPQNIPLVVSQTGPEQAKLSFDITNRTSNILNVASIIPSCSCIQVASEADQLQPGQAIKVSGYMSTRPQDARRSFRHRIAVVLESDLQDTPIIAEAIVLNANASAGKPPMVSSKTVRFVGSYSTSMMREVTAYVHRDNLSPRKPLLIEASPGLIAEITSHRPVATTDADICDVYHISISVEAEGFRYGNLILSVDEGLTQQIMVEAEPGSVGVGVAG